MLKLLLSKYLNYNKKLYKFWKKQKDVQVIYNNKLIN